MFKLEIATDNAAFSDDCNAEVARILEYVAEKVADGAISGPCIDVNGNRVGSWSMELPDE